MNTRQYDRSKKKKKKETAAEIVFLLWHNLILYIARSDLNVEFGSLLKDEKKAKRIFDQLIVAGEFMDTSSGSFYNLQGNLASLETDSFSGAVSIF